MNRLYTPHEAQIDGIHAFYDWRLGSLQPWQDAYPANPWPDCSPEGKAWLRGWHGAADIEYERIEKLLQILDGPKADRLFHIQESLYRS